ncbi:hypothetical protein ACFE04_022081 [Oxalis oulophora]
MKATIILLVVGILVSSTIKISTASSSGENNNDKRYCIRSCGSKTVSYPFGFSSDCPIQLKCNETDNLMTINGVFSVKNITESSIYVDIPAECNRTVKSVEELFNVNYAPTWQNSFLLRGCKVASNDCVIPVAYVTGRSNSTTCGNNQTVNCFAHNSSSSGVDVMMSYDSLSRTGCEYLYSSFAVDSEFSLQFQRLELSWWMNGTVDGNCDKNANSTIVNLGNGTEGYRCWCREGFKGDGFVHGSGCRRGIEIVSLNVAIVKGNLSIRKYNGLDRIHRNSTILLDVIKYPYPDTLYTWMNPITTKYRPSDTLS